MNPLVSTWRKWQRWSARIEDDLTTTVNDRATFANLGDLVRANTAWVDGHGGNAFLQFIARQFVRATAMGIRRHVKDKDDSISIARLLGEMKEKAGTVTRTVYESAFPLKPGQHDWRPLTFGTLSEDGRTLSAGMIEADLVSLTQLAANVEAFADKVIAHNDKKAWTNRVTYAELFESVDRLDELFCKYHVVLKGRQFSTLKVGNPIDLARILSVPIVDPSNKALNPTGLWPAG